MRSPPPEGSASVTRCPPAEESNQKRSALWRANSAGRAQATQLSVVVGNLDSHGYADVVVALLQSNCKTVQLLYLEHQPGFEEGAGDSLAQGLKLRARTGCVRRNWCWATTATATLGLAAGCTFWPCA